MAMDEEQVVIFRPYPLQVGQKIRIDGGPRSGDWLVIGVTERKMMLRCPVSHKEVEWDRFCSYVNEIKGRWPLID